jgi:hypothetical protein
MGLFDTYIPQPPLTCPVCGTALGNWQGKDGPCLLLLWTQRIREPRATDSDVDAKGVALPDEFLIYSYDCACFDYGVEVVGRCVDGVWQLSEFLTAELVDRFYYTLPRAERSVRIERLREAGLVARS